ncbi:N-acylneuraminate-9-phosphate synthase [Fulvimarina pelagi HTCC2506]|uniref:N-acylneuraminate-9-phosphate synthase n=1 Tax=Fulvimarina pelagi HTCC2506 TaxID=314231 RepID=Q0FYM0_9HYPH|nr:N-acetylneuraminate synthase [Fulvimarina pelagi]EAU39975.1 N-acylneuraminate-9-phosphate synthase [Fulvimarina pelagi HTCC2506]
MLAAINEWFKQPNWVFVVAEAGVNHNGSIERALDMVEAAARAGADAIKFQTFRAAGLVTANAEKAAYQKRNDGIDTNQAEMLSALELSESQWRTIKDHCSMVGISFLSTPFDEDSADFLESLGVEAFKISSGDLTHLAFLQHVARKGRPMIISTGMANLADIEEAVDAIEAAGSPPLAILHCVSDYPADPASSNLMAIPTLAAAFRRPVGWSDHTLGEATSLASIPLASKMIEKHFTLDKSLPGPDHIASLEPDELVRFVANIRTIEVALGDGRKRPHDVERDTARVARRSLVTLKEVKKGELFTIQNCGARRPGTGLKPKLLESVIGRRASRVLPAGTILALSDIG